MKGFPNQIADLSKLAAGIHALVRLVDAGENARDDGVFGEALVRAGVAGTGHTPMPVEDYIRQQRTKVPSNQSFRTTARGLRELYRYLGFIDDSGLQVEVTDLGRLAADYAGRPMDAVQLYFWRRAILSMTLEAGGEISHPYQVLRRLIEQKPGIPRAKCALALEARNDSAEELARIVALADLPEEEIRRRIGVTQSNWDNAKKVLPAFAQQLGDVSWSGELFTLVDRTAATRAARTSRKVTSATIAQAGTADRPEEFELPPEVDPAALAEAIRLRLDRLRRHNLIVKELGERLEQAGAQLNEDPFDILAEIEPRSILTEVKTLDGTEADERNRVREALSQLLYYEAFSITHIVGDAPVHKVACFEHPISDAHRDWLNRSGIAVIWKDNGGFAGDALAADILGDYIEELR
jgi:hypothetical protein